MKSILTTITTDIDKTALGFQKLKGFFLLDFDCVITKFQVVDVLGQYLLVEFKDGGLIRYRTVSFWHAFLEDDFLKIIVYDIGNKVIISRLHNIRDTDAHCDWMLIDEETFSDEILEFENH